MLSKKEAEKIIRKEIVFGKSYDKYFPSKTLEKLGYEKKRCVKCGNIFWTRDPSKKTCGDIKCEGHYSFISNKLSSKKFTYQNMWKEFSKFFKKLGHTEIDSYPVVSRWHPDLYFTMASIQGFQPYVINGEVMPPANPLIIPQRCLRFNDIENVGVTGSHYTSFIMVGQHAFNNSLTKSYFKDKAIEYIDLWLTKGMKIKEEEITFRSDAWVGGRFGGNSLEYFAGGIELGNQVYSQLKITDYGFEEIPSKTIDMGAGLERWTWFSQGSLTSYDVVFPKLVKKIFKLSGIKQLDKEFWKYSGLLNVDEIDDENKVWKKISNELGVSLINLKKNLMPIRALYSIADHTRTLLFALKDGALPSNVGGGYNLRYILRRIISLINEFNFPFSIYDVLSWQQKESSKFFIDLKDIPNLNDIIKNEENKYKKTLQKSKKIIIKHLSKKLTSSSLLKLYSSYGITPDMIKKVAKENNKEINIPHDFYEKLNQQKSKKKTKKSLDIDLPYKTEKLFYKDQYATKFKAKIIDIIDNYLILNKTLFYPTSGGQDHDTGYINNVEVLDVLKLRNTILHKVKDIKPFKKGQDISGEINWERRYSLMKNHTCTHLLNYVCRSILGDHVWQAGAEKKSDYARLDITHYKSLSWDEIKKIEEKVNELIDKNLKVEIKEYSRDKAEKKFGFRIYQGGAVPGKKLRIVKVGKDVEACGGTHLKGTKEIELFKIISVERIQDGVVRINFKTSKSAIKEIQELENNLKYLSELWDVPIKEIPITGKRFFEEWKEQRKLIEFLTKDLVETKVKFAILNNEKVIDLPTSNFGLIQSTVDKYKKDVNDYLIVLGDNVGYGVSNGEFNVKDELKKYFLNVQGSEKLAKAFKRK